MDSENFGKGNCNARTGHFGADRGHPRGAPLFGHHPARNRDTTTRTVVTTGTGDGTAGSARRERDHLVDQPARALHLIAMSRVEIEPCQPVHCLKCGVAIRCGDACRELASGYVRHRRHWSCGKSECATGFGRLLVYHCCTACYWRHRRARLRTAVSRASAPCAAKRSHRVAPMREYAAGLSAGALSPAHLASRERRAV
jgi:hypothetical protein